MALGAGSEPLAGRSAWAQSRLASLPAWIAIHWGSVIVFLLGWEFYSHSGAVTTFTLPPLSLVLTHVWADGLSGELLQNLVATLYRTVAGYLIAIVGGVALGALMTRSRLIGWFFDPIISIGFPVPKVAFLPVFILWFGIYDFSKIAMIVFSTIFPIVTATIAGAQAVDPQLIWSARSLGARERHILGEIVVPAALPQILTGIQVALPIAFVTEIISEMGMGGVGMGAAMIQASRMANSPSVFASLVEVTIAGLVLFYLATLLRRRLLRWHPETLNPAAA